MIFFSTVMNLDEVAVELLEKALEKEGELQIRASGWSMFPVIFPGDSVWIERYKTDEARMGDIILMKKQDHFILHRVWRIASSEADPSSPVFVTKGDARLRPDSPVEARCLVAKVVCCGNHPVRKFLWRTLNQGMVFLTHLLERNPHVWDRRST